jgi:hypothetical protein
VVDPTLRRSLLLAFSTTTDDDVVAASVVMPESTFVADDDPDNREARNIAAFATESNRGNAADGIDGCGCDGHQRYGWRSDGRGVCARVV